jgi:hypothetical protein
MKKTAMILSLVTMFSVMLLSSARAQDLLTGAPVDRSTRLTFNAPVSLPNLSLPAGTYVFRFVDINQSDIVQVLSEDGKTPYGQFHTVPISRSSEAAKNGELVTFKESPADAPRVIDAWFFDETNGCEMIY